MTEIPGSNDKEKQLPLRKALLIIALTTLLITGSCYAGLLYIQHMRDNQRNDPAYDIVALVQTSPHVQGVKTAYLVELLGLSIDRPTNLFRFSSSEATDKILKSPVIKQAKVRKIRPGTIHVDYELRKPIAYLGDYINTAVDESGVIFPFKPFYTPKHLPEIRLGDHGLKNEGGIQWGDRIEGASKDLAFRLLEEVPAVLDNGMVLLGVDVSNAYAPGEGKREIILRLEERTTRVVGDRSVQCIYPSIIRLKPEGYQEQLAHLLKLREYLRYHQKNEAVDSPGLVWKSKTVIMDMRLSELAFFSEEP